MLNKIFRFFYPALSGHQIIRQYNIPPEIRFKLVTKNGWTVATSESMPGFITEARNPEELLEMLNDAILTYYDVPRRVGDVVHETMTLDGFGTVSIAKENLQTA